MPRHDNCTDIDPHNHGALTPAVQFNPVSTRSLTTGPRRSFVERDPAETFRFRLIADNVPMIADSW